MENLVCTKCEPAQCTAWFEHGNGEETESFLWNCHEVPTIFCGSDGNRQRRPRDLKYSSDALNNDRRYYKISEVLDCVKEAKEMIRKGSY